MSPIVLTISPSFPICFPSFRSHSRRLHRLSVAGHVARCQLSSRVSYKSFSAIAGPMWLEHPIRQLPFPCFTAQKCSTSSKPSALSLSLAYSGDWAHQRTKTQSSLRVRMISIIVMPLLIAFWADKKTHASLGNPTDLDSDGFLIDVDVQPVDDDTPLLPTVEDRQCDVDQFFQPPILKVVDGRTKKYCTCKVCPYVLLLLLTFVM